LSKRFVTRIAAGGIDVPRSSTWRIWTSGDEIYIGARAVSGLMKASLHASGERHRGYTHEYMSDLMSKNFWTRGASRHFDIWARGLPITPVLSLEFRIHILASQLRVFSEESKANSKIKFLPAPPEGKQLVICIVLSQNMSIEKAWPFQEKLGTYLIDSHQLPNGSSLGIIYEIIDEPVNMKSNLEELYKQILVQEQEIKNEEFLLRPEKYTSKHRLIAGSKDDNDGVRCYFDLAADCLNNYKVIPV
jgi:hypothetical protein